MDRLLVAATLLSFVIAPITLPADEPETSGFVQPAPDAPAKLPPVYVKVIWPVDPATPATDKDRPVIESWITKSIDTRYKENFIAVTAWTPLDEDPLEATDVWDGKLEGRHSACDVWADVFERKDGLIKICFRGWTPFGSEATVALQLEPGSRDVVPVTQAKTKHGTPHVAIFVGLQAK